MLKHWIIVVLTLLSINSLLSSCSKKMSSDDPLSPVYEPSVIISSDNQFVYSFNPYNGTKHWEYNVGDVVKASPLLYNGMLYISTLNGVIYKLNSKTGKLLSKFSLVGKAYHLEATPIADGNLIYFGATNDTLYAVDTGTGNIKWKYGTGDSIKSSPVIHKGQVIFASFDGKIYSLDDMTGVPKWIHVSNPLDIFYSSPAVNDSFVYIGGENGKMYQLRVSDGSLRWQFPSTGYIGAIESSPIIFGGECIFGSNDYRLYCLDSQLGKKIWADSTGDRVLSSPFADPENQLIIVGSNDYNVYAFNIINGTNKWTFTSPGHYIFQSSPLVYGGLVFIGGYDKYLYALRSLTGEMVWKQNIGGVIQCSPVVDDLSGNSYNSSISGYSN
jgi:outer membrane protein assembly factor BamB